MSQSPSHDLPTAYTQSPPAEHTLVLPWVRRATSMFVDADPMRQAFSLAIAAGLNLIFSGPGGHGKSEFLNAAIGAISDANPYVKSFGQGTSCEELYGGLDFDALNRTSGAALEYNPERSFLPHLVAVFEELFDAPPRVLTTLKDTLTAGMLRNGHQTFPMATRLIVAATNHSPQDIAEGGPEIAALVERFPVQIEVKWSNYGEDAFKALFAAVTDTSHDQVTLITWEEVAGLQQRAKDVTVSRAMQALLAKIIVELSKDGIVISPRTAVMAMRLTQASAAINGRDHVAPNDVNAIAFLPGAHSTETQMRIADLISEHSRSLAAEEAMEQLEAELEKVRQLLNEPATPETLEQMIALLASIEEQATALRYDSAQIARRARILSEVKALEKSVYHQMTGASIEHDLAQLDRKLTAIKKQIARLHYAKGALTKDEARRVLAQHEAELVVMKVHPSLEKTRLSVLAQVRTAFTNDKG